MILLVESCPVNRDKVLVFRCRGVEEQPAVSLHSCRSITTALDYQQRLRLGVSYQVYCVEAKQQSKISEIELVDCSLVTPGRMPIKARGISDIGTDEGRELREKTRKVVTGKYQNVLQKLDVSERESFIALLERLIAD